MATTLYPVILAGGSGTRLWPLSRQNYPKQFLKLNGEASLLQESVQRAMTLDGESLLIISNDAHYFLCQEQLETLKKPITYLLEPYARNTAPAIAAAAHFLTHHVGKDAVMLVLPSDHWIGDIEAWKTAMQQGVDYASQHEALITFGITPNSPNTGYGYIHAGKTLQGAVQQVLSFHEKPDTETAEGFLAQGNYYWNSGMFVCRAQVYLNELAQFEPDIYQFSLDAMNQAKQRNDFYRLDPEAFAQCKNESIDYAVMEKTNKAVIIPVSMPWSDLGCWTAVADANQHDDQGNTITGKVITKNSQNCFINSEDIMVTAIGVKDQIIVATSDAVLVADKRYSQDVKDIVNTLRKEHEQLTQDHQRVSRPWGYYQILAEGPSFKVKRLMVKSGAKLSLQMHEHRAEHWVVVGGIAEVINDSQSIQLKVNQSTYIPQKTLHRLSNPGTEPLFVIEVQSGDYLGEDDIQRFDDIYSRVEK